MVIADQPVRFTHVGVVCPEKVIARHAGRQRVGVGLDHIRRALLRCQKIIAFVQVRHAGPRVAVERRAGLGQPDGVIPHAARVHLASDQVDHIIGVVAAAVKVDRHHVKEIIVRHSVRIRHT